MGFSMGCRIKKLDVQDVMNQLLAYSSTHPTMAPCMLFPIPLVTETSSSSSVICQGNKISLHVYIYTHISLALYLMHMHIYMDICYTHTVWQFVWIAICVPNIHIYIMYISPLQLSSDFFVTTCPGPRSVSSFFRTVATHAHRATVWFQWASSGLRWQLDQSSRVKPIKICSVPWSLKLARVFVFEAETCTHQVRFLVLFRAPWEIVIHTYPQKPNWKPRVEIQELRWRIPAWNTWKSPEVARILIKKSAYSMAVHDWHWCMHSQSPIGTRHIFFEWSYHLQMPSGCLTQLWKMILWMI